VGGVCSPLEANKKKRKNQGKRKKRKNNNRRNNNNNNRNESEWIATGALGSDVDCAAAATVSP